MRLRQRSSVDLPQPDGPMIAVTEPGVVSFWCDDHGTMLIVKDVPAFGYRVDYGGRSVVLSGDTRVSQNLIRHAQGADLLVHEVASPESFQRAGVRPERAKSSH